MVALSIIETVREYLRAVRETGIPVSFGVIFGSQARGTATELSDIDLLVVSSHFDGKINHEDVNRLWRLTAHTDSRVEPVPVGEKEWKEDDSRAIIEIARIEGQVVTVG